MTYSSNNNAIAVVIVEDEALIRMVMHEALSDAGFKVTDAASAKEAVEILRQDPHSVRVLFTDIHMSGRMNGCVLAHYAARHWPWIKVLVTSGQAIPTAGELPESARFVAKPYDLNRIVRQIKEMAEAA